MRLDAEWLRGPACKEVFTPLWLMRGYFSSCCPTCCNPIVPSPPCSGEAVSGACHQRNTKKCSSVERVSSWICTNTTQNLFLRVFVAARTIRIFSVAISLIFAHTSMMPVCAGVTCHYLKLRSNFNWMSQSRVLTKLSEAAYILEICWSDLVLRHSFPQFKSELSRDSAEDFQDMKQKMKQISGTARTHVRGVNKLKDSWIGSSSSPFVMIMKKS